MIRRRNQEQEKLGTHVCAAVTRNELSFFIRPPARKEQPRTRRMLDKMEPIIYDAAKLNICTSRHLGEG
jgi:hypothetical protein